jgi:nucleotide-binding universal stress UspA family protein
VLADWAGIDAHGVVVRADAIVDAIIEAAVAQEADVISVGSHRRSWFERLRRDRAAEIVDRCPCSVFVVPMERS